MTRRDYELIARALRDSDVGTRAGLSIRHHATMVGELAAALEVENSRFDRARFIAAATPSWVVGTKCERVYERLTP